MYCASLAGAGIGGADSSGDTASRTITISRAWQI
jgi:hypothetical protein